VASTAINEPLPERAIYTDLVPLGSGRYRPGQKKRQ
jgi:hypothetical protein